MVSDSNIEKPKKPSESVELREKSTLERADLSLEIMEEEYPKEKLEKAKEALEKLKKKQKPEEFEWMPMLVKAGLFAGGAYLGYKFTKELLDEDKTPEDKKFFTTPVIATSTAMLAGVGYLVGRDGLPDFFKNSFDLNATKESILKFIDKVKEGKIVEAFDFLSIDSKEPYILNSAEKIDVDKKYVLNLRDVKYSEFLKHKKGKHSGVLSYASIKALEVAGVDTSKNIPFTKTDDELRKLAAEEKISDYIDQNKGKFKNIEDLTIGEILIGLDKQKPKAPKSKTDTVKEEAEAKVSESVEELGKNAPATAKVIKSWTEGSDRDFAEKSGELVDAAGEDGAELFTYDGALFLFKNGTVFLVSSVAFFGDTVLDVAQASISEDKSAGDVVTSFIHRGGLTYVGTGAALGVLFAGLEKAGVLQGEGSVLKSAAKGALKGLIAPYNVFKASTLVTKSTIIAGQTALDNLKYLSFTSKQLLNPQNKALYEQARAVHYAEEYLKVFHEMNAKEGGASLFSKEGATAAAKETILPGKTSMLRKRYLLWFYRSRREFLKLSGIADDFKFDLRNADDEAAEMAEEAERFLAQHKTPAFEEALKTAKKGSEKLLEQTETLKKIEAIRDQAKSSDDLIKSSIAERAEMIKAGKTAAEIEAFDKVVQDLLKESSDKANDVLRGIDVAKMTKDEKTALKQLLTKDLSVGLGMKSILKEVGGRGKIALVIGSAYVVYQTYEANKEGKEMLVDGELSEIASQIGWETLELVLDVLSPFGLTDWYSAISGKGIITGRELSGWERGTRVVFGTYSLVTDALAVAAAVGTAPAAGTGGAAVYAGENAIEAAVRVALKGAGKGPEIIELTRKLLPRLSQMAESVGGYQKLLMRIQRLAKQGTYAVMAVEAVKMTYAGYQIMYNTENQSPIEFDSEMLAELEEPEMEKMAA